MTHAVPEFTIEQLEAQSTIDADSFTTDDAVALGLIAIEVIREWDVNLCVDIVLSGDLVFRAKLRDTGADNDPWLAGKAAVVRQFGEASLLVKYRQQAAGTLADTDTLRFHGGSIPIRVHGEIVGTITMSGEPDTVDHEAANEAVQRFLG
jgi:uncharacterized protein (UPF0303 family)